MDSLFWLDDLTELINIENFSFSKDSIEQRKIKLLNLTAVFSVIVGALYYQKTKNNATKSNK